MNNLQNLEQLIALLLRAQVLAPTIVGFVNWIQELIEGDQRVRDTRTGTIYQTADAARAAGVPDEAMELVAEVPSPAQYADMIDALAAANADFNRDEIERLKAKLASPAP